MKKYVIKVASEEMFKRDYRYFKNAYDKYYYYCNDDWEIYEEFDDEDEAEKFFKSIKPSYVSLSCSGGNYKLCDIYEFLERVKEHYGEDEDDYTEILLDSKWAF